MIDDVTLDAACLAYERAQARYVRTSRQDPALDRRCVERDEAYDRLVYLLVARGEVHHHAGLALWVESGELHRAKIETYRALNKGAAK